MNSMPVQASLVADPAIRACLEGYGFRVAEPGVFAHERAMVRFDGDRLAMVPADGSRIWRAEVRDAEPKFVTELLDAILVTPPFLSPEGFARQEEMRTSAARALESLVRVIMEQPNSPMSKGVCKFLWSLFNGFHPVSLWRVRDSIDRRVAGLCAEIFTSWIQGNLPEDMLRRTLMDLGELDTHVNREEA